MNKHDKTNIKLFEILNNEIFSSEFISGIAGDRNLSQKEVEIYKTLIDETGDDLYVKLLFYITHQVFPPKESKKLWEQILQHKKAISGTLGRNVDISVATLDYLTNIKSMIKNPKIIGEAFIGKIAEITSIDGLTKLYNRQYLLLKMNEEINRYNRYNATFSILIFDIDDFKHVNDRYGHQKGDRILMDFGSIFLNSKRDLDICARYGGEEFVIVLPHTNMTEAEIIAERYRSVIENKYKNNIGVTTSIGISNCPKSSNNLEILIKKADEALYRSKETGKNKVTSV